MYQRQAVSAILFMCLITMQLSSQTGWKEKDLLGKVKKYAYASFEIKQAFGEEQKNKTYSENIEFDENGYIIKYDFAFNEVENYGYIETEYKDGRIDKRTTYTSESIPYYVIKHTYEDGLLVVEEYQNEQLKIKRETTLDSRGRESLTKIYKDGYLDEAFRNYYNDNGTLAKVERYFTTDGKLLSTDYYSYDTNNRITSIKMIMESRDGYTISQFSYSGSKKTEVRKRNTGEIYFIYSIDYDSEGNPLKAIETRFEDKSGQSIERISSIEEYSYIYF